MINELNVLAESWFTWMFSMFWQVSLLILIISGIEILFRNLIWPQVRYALWILVLVKLIVPPSWAFSGSIVPNIRSEFTTQTEITNVNENQIVQRNSSKNEGVVSNNLSEKPGEIQKSIPAVENKNESLSSTNIFSNWKTYLMLIWAIGIIVFATLLGLKIWKLKKWHRGQEERKKIPDWFHNVLVKVGKTLSINRLPAIVYSNEILTPAVYGIFKPVLLLPEKYIDELTEEEAEHVLLHELAHVKRGDLIVHGICLILQIIYWFNPFLIWARKQMKHVREICCDITIANILREKTKLYKETLVNTARELLTETMEPGMGLLGLFEEPFQLIARLKWLNKETWKSRKLAYGSAILTTLLFTAFVLPMGELGPNFNIPNTNYSDNEGVENYKERVTKLTSELQKLMINKDFEKMRNYYTDDVIIDEDSRPSISGKDNVIYDMKQQLLSGTEFNSLESYFTDFWNDGKNLNVVEQFYYTITLAKPNIKISGSGRTFTIWEIQDDDSIKIKYSILNLDSLNPKIVEGDI